jgi:hypothetical protein
MAIQSGRDKVFKLIARGTELDLFQDETIYLSNNVTGLFDIGKLPSDFTRQITLPGTKKNNDFFQHVYDISIDEPYLFKTNEKVIAQFDFDGFYVSQGYIQLNKVNLKENKYIESYEVSVFGLLSSFKRDLQSITLSNLAVLDNYNHIFSTDNILTSWSGSAGASNTFTSSVDGHSLSGEIVYMLTDSGKQHTYQASLSNNLFGIDTEGGRLYAQDFKPAIRLDLVLDAIFDQTQYTYESTFLSESKFDNTFVLCDRGLKYPVISGTDLEINGQIQVGPVSGSSTPLDLISGVTQSLLFTNVYDDPSFSIVAADGEYKPFFGDVEVISSNGLGELKLNLLVTGSSTAYPELTLYRQPNTPSGAPNVIPLTYMNDYIRRDFLNTSGEKEYTLTQEFNTDFASGSSYDFNIGFTTGGTGTINVTIGPEGNTESRLKIKTLNEIGDLMPIDMPANMPFGTNGITLLDFLASVQKKFNLQIYPSKTKPRHFIIETFNNWYKQGKVKNFDNYMDLNRTISVTPANNLGVREVEFGDTLDQDFLTQNFKKQNNREFGKSYFRDTQNFFSDGKLQVETGLGVSPLRYVVGSGTEGFAVVRLTAFYAVIANSPSVLCVQTEFQLYHDGAGARPTFGDTVYYDVNGTTAVFAFNYILLDNSPTIYNLNPGTGVFGSIFGTCAGGGEQTYN